VVENGVAYAVAGFQSDNGVFCAAVDAATGAVRWETDGGLRKGPTLVCGHVAVGAGRLWLTGGSGGSFSLAGGESGGEWLGNARSSRGSDLGIFVDRWMIFGGQRITETQDTLEKPMGAAFSAFPLDGSISRERGLSGGKGMTSATAAPVWDESLFVLAAKDKQAFQVTALPAKAMLSWLAGQPGEKNSAQADIASIKAWSTEVPTPVAMALSKDLLIVAHAPDTSTSATSGQTRPSGSGFRVSGFRRTDGFRAWSVELPVQPVMNRMAIGRDGRILVCLVDGSVVCLGD
jgi:hypothetical protein